MELACKVQNYAWGVSGMESSVAQLAKAADPTIVIDKKLPYAELWMGTHPNGPSTIRETSTLLSTYIEKYPQCLGPNITSKFGNELCFLFKVLSVNQALSIQAHPEKSHAEKLHNDRPDVYKDPNHKPEMAIALTPFKALCGFRPSEQIKYFFKELPPLRKIVGEENALSFASNPSEEALKKCFSVLMNSPKEAVTEALEEMAKTLNSESGSDLQKDLFFTLLTHYPGDVGCFSIYLLNYFVFQPGEAMFYGPNVIHAYLLGDCIECMACSDNVVRAGLTPKFQDVDTLLQMLEYEMIPSELWKFEGTQVNDHTTLFNPPVPDFAVQKIQVKAASTIDLTTELSASVLLVIKGSGGSVSVRPPNSDGSKSPANVQRGSILFIEAGQTVSLNVDDEFLAFRALCV